MTVDTMALDACSQLRVVVCGCMCARVRALSVAAKFDKCPVQLAGKKKKPKQPAAE